MFAFTDEKDAFFSQKAYSFLGGSSQKAYSFLVEWRGTASLSHGSSVQLLRTTVSNRRGRTVTYKILVVDDDHTTVELIRLSLHNEHFETLEAYDGIEALAVTRSEAPDLIILDWMLPHISGL